MQIKDHYLRPQKLKSEINFGIFIHDALLTFTETNFQKMLEYYSFIKSTLTKNFAILKAPK